MFDRGKQPCVGPLWPKNRWLLFSRYVLYFSVSPIEVSLTSVLVYYSLIHNTYCIHCISFLVHDIDWTLLGEVQRNDSLLEWPAKVQKNSEANVGILILIKENAWSSLDTSGWLDIVCNYNINQFRAVCVLSVLSLQMHLNIVKKDSENKSKTLKGKKQNTLGSTRIYCLEMLWLFLVIFAFLLLLHVKGMLLKELLMQKWKFCHRLFTNVCFQTSMTFILPWDTKGDILKKYLSFPFSYKEWGP